GVTRERRHPRKERHRDVDPSHDRRRPPPSEGSLAPVRISVRREGHPLDGLPPPHAGGSGRNEGLSSARKRRDRCPAPHPSGWTTTTTSRRRTRKRRTTRTKRRKSPDVVGGLVLPPSIPIVARVRHRSGGGAPPSTTRRRKRTRRRGLRRRGDLVLAQKVPLSGITSYEAGARTGYSTYGEYGDVILYWPNGQGSTPIIHRAILYLEWNPNSFSYNATDLTGLPCGTSAPPAYSYVPLRGPANCDTTGLTGTL